MELKKIVANNIRSYRKLAGLTQAELAERTGMNVRHLSQIENAGLNLTLDTLERIAIGLSIVVSQLVDEGKREIKPPKRELAGIETAIRLLKGYKSQMES